MNKLQLSEEQFNSIIDLALAEDLAHGDVTSEALIPPEFHGRHLCWLKPREYWPAAR